MTDPNNELFTELAQTPSALTAIGKNISDVIVAAILERVNRPDDPILVKQSGKTEVTRHADVLTVEFKGHFRIEAKDNRIEVHAATT